MKALFKKNGLIAFVIIFTVLLAACHDRSTLKMNSGINKNRQESGHSIIFKDSLGNEVKLDKKPERVVSLLGSFTEVWQLAGGTAIGVTDDVKERGIKVPDNAAIVGSGHTPNLEIILSLKPDFVILSAEYSNHLQLAEFFKENNIPAALFRVETFKEYLNMLKIFTDITGQQQLYEKNGSDVKKRVYSIINKVNVNKRPTVLLIRAYTKGVNALDEDDMTGYMLKELRAENIASHENGLLKDLSMETIINKDPDYIFVTLMGSETKKALDRLKETVQSNPSWNNLSAVKNGRYIVLPKELFQYKPNSRWDEAYEYIAKILYP